MERVDRWSDLKLAQIEECVYAGSDPAVLKLPAKGGKPQIIVGLKGLRSTGTFGLWLGLDSTDVPLLLRDLGSDDVFSLSLEHK